MGKAKNEKKKGKENNNNNNYTTHLARRNKKTAERKTPFCACVGLFCFLFTCSFVAFTIVPPGNLKGKQQQIQTSDE